MFSPGFNYKIRILNIITWGSIIGAIVHDYTFSARGPYAWTRDTSIAYLSYASEMSKGDRTVVLIGMVHTAQLDFYRDVQSYMGVRDFISLEEGIEDVTGIARIPESYQDPENGLESFGLVGQDQAMKPWLKSLHADVDLMDLSLNCRNYIRIIFGDLNVSTIGETKGNCSQEIIEVRNGFVFEKAKEQLKSNKTVLIAWGAAHLPGIKSLLEAEGFTETKLTTLVVDSLYHRAKRFSINLLINQAISETSESATSK